MTGRIDVVEKCPVGERYFFNLQKLLESMKLPHEVH